MPEPSENPHRLPRTAIPSRYELSLEPNLQEATFKGEVTISVTVAEPTDTLMLNATELVIDDAVVRQPGGEDLKAEVSLDEDAERATLKLASSLPAGYATVYLRFQGILNDQLRGFYRSVFTDDDGVEHVLATTQMESTDARRAFPCWDEPDLKAVFGVTLVVDDGLLAISNAAEVGRAPADDGKVAVRFADTMKMSTYLVAFIVGPLEATEAVDVDGTPLRVIHPPNRGHLTEFALDVGAFALRYFSDWFGIPYAGDKLDLVAIPDFAFGAMENVGCVTFRERLLLVDPEVATHDECLAVVDVISHELAHMWFGNLVTMRWWNGIWLNEAFATFMEMLATDAYRPKWERWAAFGRERNAAFDTDALTTTRPIEYPVHSPRDAEGMFDVLTYKKGSAVVRMLEQYLGPDRFREGIRLYMQRHSYGNTETSELWDALEAATGEPVRRIAESWIFQGGFPQVAVSSSSPGTIDLTQQLFQYGGEGQAPAAATTSEARWAVPMVIRSQSDGEDDPVDRRVLLDDETIQLDLGDYPRWINANADASGFFRVSYAPELRTRLVANRSALRPVERYTLVDDTWASVLAGGAEAMSFLGLAEEMADEDDQYVWERLLGGLSFLERLLENDARDRYAARVRTLLGPIMERVGSEPAEGEDDRMKSLRGDLLIAAAVVGRDPEAQHRAHTVLGQYLEEPESVDASIGSAALVSAAAFGDVQLHQRLEAAFRSAATPQERQRLLRAFGAFRVFEAMERTLSLATSGVIRSQDAPYLVGDTLTNRDNAAAAWKIVVKEWDQMNERFPANSISRMLGGVRTIRDRTLAEHVGQFLDDHPIPQGDKQIRQHRERMWVTVALAEREATRFTDAV